ncbi:MAG: NAD-dependent epimerase/dehydratase family protein [Bacteroidota bacterium]|nr:NAD-dependent epimerase/dehydratase family protein [Bacteroidota bacterium]
MKFFVTGASGFIGSVLCFELAEAGNIVHAYGRTVQQCPILKHRKIKLFIGDILEIEALEKAIYGCERGFHLAALVKVNVKDPEEYYRVNVQGTINVMELCLKHNVKKLVFTSSCGTFPPSGVGITDEQTKRNGDFFNEYAKTKYIAEQKAMKFIITGFDVVAVSPTRVYGPGPLRVSNSISKIIKMYLNGRWRILPGNGKAIGNYAFIDDVVRGHIQAMNIGKSGENYLLGGENISFNDFIDYIKKFTGENKWMIRINSSLIYGLIIVQEKICILIKKPPFITTSWFRRLEQSAAYSSNKAINQLDYKITPFSKGIKRTIDFLKINNL